MSNRPKGPSTQIVEFQGPKTHSEYGFWGPKSLTIWVLGPSGLNPKPQALIPDLGQCLKATGLGLWGMVGPDPLRPQAWL